MLVFIVLIIFIYLFFIFGMVDSPKKGWLLLFILYLYSKLQVTNMYIFVATRYGCEGIWVGLW